MVEWKDDHGVSEVATPTDFKTRMGQLGDRMRAVTLKSHCHVSICDSQVVDGLGDCDLTGTLICIHIDDRTSLFTPQEAEDIAAGMQAALQHACGTCLSCQLTEYLVRVLTDAVRVVQATSFAKH